MKDTADRDYPAAEHREIFGRLADVLVPRSGSMPAASEVGAAGRGLDRVLASRPDMTSTLRNILDEASLEDPETFVARLEHADSERFAVLLSATVGSYYMSEEVRERLGYSGQITISLHDRADEKLQELVEPVVERGFVYRETS